MASQIHGFSTVKLQLLQQAKSSYQAAASSLPPLEANLGIGDNVKIYSQSSTSSDDSDFLDYYRSSPEVSDALSHILSPSSVESVESVIKGYPLQQFPTRIRKNGSDSAEDSYDHYSVPADMLQTPTRHRSSTSAVTFWPISPTSSAPTDKAWLAARSYERYKEYLTTFTKMLAKHIAVIDSLIYETQQCQHRKFSSSRRVFSYEEGKEAKKADLQARIARLRANGWKMERFDPGKYQELCERALAGL